MRTVKSLREELTKFPDDAFCKAYEGEIIGVVVRDSSNKKQLGYVECDRDTADDEEADLTVKLPAHT